MHTSASFQSSHAGDAENNRDVAEKADHTGAEKFVERLHVVYRSRQ